MTLDQVKQQAAITSLNTMMKKGWLDICAIKSIATMLEVQLEPKAHAILQPLHCVHFSDMPRELYAQIPVLIQQALCGAEIFQFESRKTEPLPIVLGSHRPKLLARVFGKSA